LGWQSWWHHGATSCHTATEVAAAECPCAGEEGGSLQGNGRVVGLCGDVGGIGGDILQRGKVLDIL
jgi:hypothetical protein